VELLRLGPYLEKYVRDLSHGGRRIVTVGRALMTAPSLLVLDEPGAGLDEAESSALGTLLRKTAEDGTSILLVDHDMSLVLESCDRVTVLDFGSVLAEGTPEEIRRSPAVRAAYLGEVE
jgi:ABC-type branched-subunit amino acid transport system ATPase component